jgi:hypothetical protein
VPGAQRTDVPGDVRQTAEVIIDWYDPSRRARSDATQKALHLYGNAR